MKNLIQIATTLTLFISAGTAKSSSPEPQCEATPEFSIGTDLGAWALDGHSLILSSVSGNCRILLETWGIVVPDSITNLNKDNKDKGWQREITEGYSLHLDTFYGPEDQGWFSGLMFSHFRSEITRRGYEDKVSSKTSEVLLKFGYKWDLTDHFSLEPWIGFGPIWEEVDDSPVGGETYEKNLGNALVTIHGTYKFNP